MNVGAMTEISTCESRDCVPVRYGEIKIMKLSKWSGGDFDQWFDPVVEQCCSLSENVEDMFNSTQPPPPSLTTTEPVYSDFINIEHIACQNLYINNSHAKSEADKMKSLRDISSTDRALTLTQRLVRGISR